MHKHRLSCWQGTTEHITYIHIATQNLLTSSLFFTKCLFALFRWKATCVRAAMMGWNDEFTSRFWLTWVLFWQGLKSPQESMAELSPVENLRIPSKVRFEAETVLTLMWFSGRHIVWELIIADSRREGDHCWKTESLTSYE